MLLGSVLHNNLTGMTIRFANCHICLTAVRGFPHAAINITAQYITRSFIVFNGYLFVIDITTANDVYLWESANYFSGCFLVLFCFFRNLYSIEFPSLKDALLSCPPSPPTCWPSASRTLLDNSFLLMKLIFLVLSYKYPNRFVEGGKKKRKFAKCLHSLMALLNFSPKSPSRVHVSYDKWTNISLFRLPLWGQSKSCWFFL